MKLPAQSPPVQRDLLISECHRERDGVQAAEAGVFGPFGPFAGLAPHPPHITFEFNTWLQVIPPDEEGKR